MEALEVFKRLRDTAGAVVDAFEKNDEAAMNKAMGEFLLLMCQLDCLQ